MERQTAIGILMFRRIVRIAMVAEISDPSNSRSGSVSPGTGSDSYMSDMEEKDSESSQMVLLREKVRDLFTTDTWS